MFFVAPLVGAWIEILKSRILCFRWSCRTPRGCVNWNAPFKLVQSEKAEVAPLVGAWIEIFYGNIISSFS